MDFIACPSSGYKPPAKPSKHSHQSRSRRQRAFRPPPIGRLEAALAELVNELFAYRRRRVATGSRLRYFTLGQLQATPEPVLAARDLVDNPVNDALRDKIKEVGGYLAARLTFDELLQLAKRVSNDGSDDAGAVTSSKGAVRERKNLMRAKG